MTDPYQQSPRPGNPFGPENAIDGEESTFWMPAQVPQEGVPNFITLDMTCLGETKQWKWLKKELGFCHIGEVI